MEALVALVMEFAAKYPAVAVVFFVMGALRSVMKPIFSALRAYVEYTPNPADNLVLDKVEASAVVKTIAWVLDYAASVKILK